MPNWTPALRRRRGRKPRVPLDQVLQGLTFHVTQGAGTLAEHFFELFQEPLADSSWSDRRRRLPWEVFADLMRRALRPIATRRRQPDASWRGWRVLALDGTQYSWAWGDGCMMQTHRRIGKRSGTENLEAERCNAKKSKKDEIVDGITRKNPKRSKR